jgi:hypothetical protein
MLFIWIENAAHEFHYGMQYPTNCWLIENRPTEIELKVMFLPNTHDIGRSTTTLAALLLSSVVTTVQESVNSSLRHTGCDTGQEHILGNGN